MICQNGYEHNEIIHLLFHMEQAPVKIFKLRLQLFKKGLTNIQTYNKTKFNPRLFQNLDSKSSWFGLPLLILLSVYSKYLKYLCNTTLEVFFLYCMSTSLCTYFSNATPSIHGQQEENDAVENSYLRSYYYHRSTKSNVCQGRDGRYFIVHSYLDYYCC